MNNPLKMGKDSNGNWKYPIHRFKALGMMLRGTKGGKIGIGWRYGRPLRKASRIGQPKGLNKVGHRNNPAS